MKKSILLMFVMAAGFVATFLTGCGDDTDGPTCYTAAGRDTGAHIVFLGDIDPAITPIRDTLDVSVSGSAVSIVSKALGKTLNGTVSSSNCNLITMDSFFIGSGPSDTLKIPTTSSVLTLTQGDGVVRIWNVRAGGTGEITSTGSKTKLQIARANTNISGPIDLRNITSILNLNLRGTFKNLP